MISNEKIDLDKKCFVLSPLDNPDPEMHRISNIIYDYIIQPTVMSLGYETLLMNQITHSDVIDSIVIQYTLESPIVIADLTGLSPMIFYCIGVRHTIRKPLILINSKQTIPFDVIAVRIIQFNKDDLASVVHTQEALRQQIKFIEKEKPVDIDTPVSFASNLKKFKEIQNFMPRLYQEIKDRSQRDKLEALNDEDQKLIKAYEQSMKRYYDIWTEVYPHLSTETNPIAKAQINDQLKQITNNMCSDLNSIIYFMEKISMDVSDRYHHIRHICNQFKL